MQNTPVKNDNIILSIWFALKRNWVLVCAIIIACTFVGTIVGLTKKPNYTSNEEVVFTAEADDANSNIVTNFNIMSAYVNTVIDFCDEGVVIDRANFYYAQYLLRQDPSLGYFDDDGYTVDDFIYDIKNVEDPYPANRDNVTVGKYILKSNVGVSAKVETNETDQYSFSLRYTDPDKDQSIVKTKIYVMSFILEVQPQADKDGVKYFDGIKINITELGIKGSPIADMSRSRFILIGLLAGIVAAVVTVYIIKITDVTVNSKEDLEAITGVDVLTFIEEVGGAKNARNE